VPQLVIETTSLKTKKKDTFDKPELYAKLGVHEYFMHDPTGEYLDPPLQGYRLQDGKYEKIAADAGGGLQSEELGLLLRVEDGELNLFQPGTNQRLLTYQESASREAEGRQRAEAEVERLRAELAKYQQLKQR
jgi:hypothetical protein